MRYAVLLALKFVESWVAVSRSQQAVFSRWHALLLLFGYSSSS